MFAEFLLPLLVFPFGHTSVGLTGFHWMFFWPKFVVVSNTLFDWGR